MIRVTISLLLILRIGIGFSQTKVHKVDSLFSYCYENGIFNGNVLIAEKGKIIYNKSFGYADFESKTELEKNTTFSLASITKPFTSMGIMILEEQQKLSYSDNLKKYFPNLPIFLHDITIKHLLRHTSGLARGHFKSNDRLKNEALLDKLMDTDSLAYQTGTNLKYSNSAYVLLAMIIEKASEQPFKQFMKKEIFEPLGMTNTFVFNIEQQNKNVAIGYNGFGDKSIYDLITYGSAGIYSTTEDLFRWSQALSTDKILTKETIKAALSPASSSKGQVLELQMGGVKMNYGMGFFIFKDKWDGIVGHSGAFGGFYNIIMKDTNYDRELIILSNNGRLFSIFDLSFTVQAILYDRPFQLPQISVDLAIRERCFDNIDEGITLYHSLKKEAPQKYNFENESGLNQLGYALIKENKIKSAIKIFELFASEFPESFRPYHGLGKAYYIDNRYKLSLKNYQKSFDINKT